MKKKSVLLINAAPGRKDHQYFPLGIGYLAAIASRRGHKVKCLDCQSPDVGISEITGSLDGVDVVGIRAFANDFSRANRIAAAIKAVKPTVLTVLGGPLATHSHAVLNRKLFDLCVAGEADLVWPDILSGACVYSGGYVRGEVPHDLGALPMPLYEAFDMDLYATTRGRVRTMDILTGRGCPFSCKFCGKIEGVYRKRNPDAVREEIQILIGQYGIRHFSVNDELFCRKHGDAWVYAFCQDVTPLRITWNATTRAHGLNLDVLRAMKEAGCTKLIVGVESASRQNLKTMNKRISPEDIAQSITLIRMAGIEVGTTLIIGFPGETDLTVMETVEFYRALNLPPKTWAFLQPYPGSAFFDEANLNHVDTLERLSAGDRLKRDLAHNFTDMPDRNLVALKREAEAAMASNWRRQNRLVWAKSKVKSLLRR